jgi:hypothetical protein
MAHPSPSHREGWVICAGREPLSSLRQISLYSKMFPLEAHFTARRASDNAVTQHELHHPSIRPNPLKRSCPTPIVKRPVVRIGPNHSSLARPIRPPAKRQNISRLRPHHQMLNIDRPLHPARLIRPLEVPFDRSAFLLQFKVLRRSRPIRILAIQSPVARNIRRLLLCRRLLRPCNVSHDTN